VLIEQGVVSIIGVLLAMLFVTLAIAALGTFVFHTPIYERMPAD
jgi:hypothetical protein